MTPPSAFLSALEPFLWVFVGFLVVNVAMFTCLVALREESTLFLRRRARVRERLAPFVERVESHPGQESVAALVAQVARLGRADIPAAAWLLHDVSKSADEATRAAIRDAVRTHAGNELRELGERGTRRWMPWRRVLACDILGSFSDERSIGILEPCLHDSRVEVREAAARALGRIGSPDAATLLIPLFLEGKSVAPGVAYDALRGLGETGADVFEQALESDEPSIRVSACFGCSSLPRPSTPALLARILAEDENVRVRAAAAKALGLLGGAAAPPALLAAARSPELRIRREAVVALRAFDDPRAVKPLADAMEDEERAVSLRAAEGLLELAGRTRAGEAARAALSSASAWSLDYARVYAGLST